MNILKEHRELLSAAVQATVISLDLHLPNWRDEIDWDDFEFKYNDKCIKGQLRRRFDFCGNEVTEIGFNVPRCISEAYVPRSADWLSLWDFMEQEWKKQQKVLDKTLVS